jgi:hypothetical protein
MSGKTTILASIIVIVFIFGIHSAYATVVLSGDVTIGGKNSNIYTNGSTITVNDLSVGSSGMTTRASSTDNEYTYSFASNSNPNLKMLWTSITDTQANFQVYSGGLTDVTGQTLGSQLYEILVDNTNVGNSFANGINQFTIGAGSVIQEIFNNNTPPPGGGGGGGGGGGSPAPANLVQQPAANNAIVNPIQFSITPKSYFLQPGQILNSESLTVAWNDTNELTINSITVANSPISIVFPTPPLSITGSSMAPSSGLIPFSITVPTQYCSSTTTTECVYPISYNIPVTIVAQDGNQILTQSTTISIAFNQNIGPVFYVAIAAIIAGIGGGIAYRLFATRKKERKSGEKLSFEGLMHIERGKHKKMNDEDLGHFIKRYRFKH